MRELNDFSLLAAINGGVNDEQANSSLVSSSNYERVGKLVGLNVATAITGTPLVITLAKTRWYNFPLTFSVGAMIAVATPFVMLEAVALGGDMGKKIESYFS